MHAPPFVPQTSSGPSRSLTRCSQQNVGENERLVSLLGGAGLLLNALLGPRRSRPLSLLAGGALLYRGWTARCAIYELLGIGTADSSNGLPHPAQPSSSSL